MRLLDHSQTHHTRYDSSGRVIGTSQIPLPYNTQHSQQKDIYAPSGIRTRNSSNRAAADSRFIPRGPWGRLFITIFTKNTSTLSSICYLYQQMHTHTHTHVYIYIYIKILNYIKKRSYIFQFFCTIFRHH